MDKINVEERVDRGVKYFMQGYNCSQSVALAFADIYDVPEELMARIAASFGGGIGRMRLTCGTVSGMAILAGLECGSTNPADAAAKGRNYAEVQGLAEKFREANGSITCAELLKMRSCKVETAPSPDVRNAEYYAARPCARMVASACRIYAWMLQECDDLAGKTLVAASSKGITEGTKCEIAEKVGEAAAKKALEAGISAVVFDRNGYLFHGRVKSLADGARKGGLKF